MLSLGIRVCLATACVLCSRSACALPERLDWRLIARSHHIVVGNLDVPDSEAQGSDPSLADGYAEFTLTHTDSQKGAVPDPVTIRYYAAASKPLVETIAGLRGKSVVAFLVQSDAPDTKGYYLTPLASFPLLAASSRLRDELSHQIDEQRRLLGAFDAGGTSRGHRTRSRVQELIHALVQPATQDQAVEGLLALDLEAVPFIIAAMDDLTPLPKQHMSIRLDGASENAEEGVMQYTPEVVVDALDVVLSQLTGEVFSSIANGGSAREREGAIEAWKIYWGYYSSGKTTKMEDMRAKQRNGLP